MGPEAHERQARDEAQPGGDQRHAGGAERAEGEQQDDECRDHAHPGGVADAEALGLLDHLAARRELQPRHVDGVDGVQHRLPCLVGQEVGALVVVDGGKRRGAVLGYLDSAL